MMVARRAPSTQGQCSINRDSLRPLPPGHRPYGLASGFAYRPEGKAYDSERANSQIPPNEDLLYKDPVYPIETYSSQF